MRGGAGSGKVINICSKEYRHAIEKEYFLIYHFTSSEPRSNMLLWCPLDLLVEKKSETRRLILDGSGVLHPESTVHEMLSQWGELFLFHGLRLDIY